MSSRRGSQRRPSELTPLLQEVPPEPIEADRGIEQQQDAPEDILIDEPSKRKLAAIMASIWLGVFLGALGSFVPTNLGVAILTSTRRNHHSHPLNTYIKLVQFLYAPLMARIRLLHCQCSSTANIWSIDGYLRSPRGAHILQYLLLRRKPYMRVSKG